MPRQIDGKQKEQRASVDAYHTEMLRLVNIVRKWKKSSDFELQEYLDDDNDLLPEPEQFREFRETWQTAMMKGRKARVFQREQSLHNLKIIAKELWGSEVRLRFYAGTLTSRIRCRSSEGVEPVSALELEQQYQHALYKKGRSQNGFESVPFRVWLSTPCSVTFYNDL